MPASLGVLSSSEVSWQPSALVRDAARNDSHTYSFYVRCLLRDAVISIDDELHSLAQPVLLASAWHVVGSGLAVPQHRAPPRIHPR